MSAPKQFTLKFKRETVQLVENVSAKTRSLLDFAPRPTYAPRAWLTNVVRNTRARASTHNFPITLRMTASPTLV
jgi:hypothetical protein